MKHASRYAGMLLALTVTGAALADDARGTTAPVHEVLDVDAAVALALSDNPGLAELRARAEALAAIPSQVGTLPDPMVSFNAMSLPVDTFDLGQEPMTQLQLGVSQAIPFPGKLALREAAAAHEAEAAENSVEERRLTLVRDVRSVWWSLYYLDRALEIVARNADLLRQFVDIARTKYEVGQGIQQDVLLAQVELSKLFDLDLQLRGVRGNEVARLNALLDRAVDAPVRLPAEVSVTLPPVASVADLYAAAQTARPWLAEQQARIEAAHSRRELAELDLLPDLQLGAAYGFRSGADALGNDRPDFATFMASMSVPVFAARKQRRAIDQRTAEVLQQTYALQDRLARVRQEIAAAHADYERARAQAELFDGGIIPQARQTVASMLAGYQVNKVDFLNLVRAQITLYNYEMQYWKSVAEARQAAARLAAAVGKETIHE